MKMFLMLSLLMVSSLSFAVDKKNVRKPNQKAYTYTDEKKMPLASCLEHMSAFAQSRKLTLVMWQAGDFYVNDSSGEKIGNAYHSQETCYIYLD